VPKLVIIDAPLMLVGKTISVSMFAAALLYSCAGVELSIYSTCKRISQKLLRNVVKFLNLIYENTGEPPMKIIRANCEEIHIQGPEGTNDVRVTNSYPSKVCLGFRPYTHTFSTAPGLGCKSRLFTDSTDSTGSTGSAGSVGSSASAGSAGSSASAGSTGSMASAGSAGSAVSAVSPASAVSVVSPASAVSPASSASPASPASAASAD
jgi:hypothetical protein